MIAMFSDFNSQFADDNVEKIILALKSLEVDFIAMQEKLLKTFQCFIVNFFWLFLEDRMEFWIQAKAKPWRTEIHRNLDRRTAATTEGLNRNQKFA